MSKACKWKLYARMETAHFMGAWKNAFFLQEKPMSIKFVLFFGGRGDILGFGGGAISIFMGARIFVSEIPFSEWRLLTCAMRTPQFSEQVPGVIPGIAMGPHMGDFHLPMHSRSVFSRIGFVPARQRCWGSPKASHIKPSHPHFPRFRVRIFRIFRVFARWNLLRSLFFWGERDRPHFPHFRRFGFESLISKIRPTGFIMTGLRWPGDVGYGMVVDGLKLQRISASNLQNKAFHWKCPAWRVNFSAWNLAIPYTTNPCPTFSRLIMSLRIRLSPPRGWKSTRSGFGAQQHPYGTNGFQQFPTPYPWRRNPQKKRKKRGIPQYFEG